MPGYRQAAHIAFESMETFLKVLTANRWTLLRSLRGRGPSSIRALAQTLGRDYRGVHADVAVLVDGGLIERDDSTISVPLVARGDPERAEESRARLRAMSQLWSA